jgi:hypothetical protein
MPAGQGSPPPSADLEEASIERAEEIRKVVSVMGGGEEVKRSPKGGTAMGESGSSLAHAMRGRECLQYGEDLMHDRKRGSAVGEECHDERRRRKYPHPTYGTRECHQLPDEVSLVPTIPTCK